MSNKQNDIINEYQLETLNFVAQEIAELREDESEEGQIEEKEVSESEELELARE